MHADFGLSIDHHVLNNERQYTLAGITCYDPCVIKTLPRGRYSITPFLRQWADQKKFTGESYHGSWYDTGTPSRLAEARASGPTDS